MIRKLPTLNMALSLVLFLVLTSVLPLLVLGLTSYNTSRSVIEENVSNDNRVLMADQQAYLDLLLEQVEGLITNVSGVEDIKIAVNDDGTYNPADEYTRLATHAKIGYILSGYVGVKGLISIDIFTLGGAHYHVGDTLNVQDIDKAVLNRIRAEALASDKLIVWTGVENNVNTNSTNKKVITAARLFRTVDIASLQEKPGALLMVNYSVDSLYDHFSEVNPGSGAFIIVLDTHGRLVYHPDQRNIGLQVLPAFLEQMSGESGSFVSDVDGRKMLVTYTRSRVSDWRLASLVPLSSLTASADAIRNITFSVVAISLAFALAMMWVVSRNVVQPIKRITELFKQIQGGTFDGRVRLAANRTDEIGELTRWFNAFLDSLAAQHKAEQELVRAKEAADEARITAEAANRAKSVFLANMSHELRTPLNAILGFSDLMAHDANTQLTAEQKENLAIINRSGEHLLMLINDVLDMAKIESGRATVQRQAFDLHQMLGGLIDMFRVRATDKGLALIVDRAPDVPRFIVADEGKLRQVLINLLSNAVKFTDEGGIGLRVRWATPAAGPDTPSLAFEVQDTGRGIASQDLGAIFDPFVQSVSNQKFIEGTGLGLAISRQYARLLCGDLTAASHGVPGQGALFTLQVPVGLADQASLATGEKPARPRAVGLEPGQSNYRLLVVEDREENRLLLVRLLARLGFEVHAAVNGLEAINLWKEWQPHLIWMDMRMPVMDGHEATHRIKATPQGQSTIIIALTASAFEDERERVLAEGCDDFVRKPFREDEIVDKLIRHLGVRFTYEGDSAPAELLAPQPAALDLTGLPANWVARLEQAAIEADADLIAALAGEIREQRPALTLALTELLDNFQYQAILAAINDSAQGGQNGHAK